MAAAYGLVMANKGCAGIDGLKLEELEGYLQTHWHELKQTILC